jgi:FKBP-type peptidyl-prolyl cis-trans isomerase FklB
MRRLATLTAITISWLAVGNAAFSQDELPPAAESAPPRSARPAIEAVQAPAAAPAGPEYMQQVSYGIGQNMAQQIRDSQIEGLDLKSLLAGISDALAGAKPKWTEEQLRPSMIKFSQEMRQKAMARITQQAAKNKQESAAFLAKNAKREGVQTTASGLQYLVLKQADGPSPTLNDTVRCNYRGTLLNGTEFDNSAQSGGPAEFKVVSGPGGLIPGWVEALQKMHVGEKWQLFVPPQLAYGDESPGPPIEPNSLLVFELELLEIVPQ